MKFMKLGTRPDTFYTEEATRTVISDIPSDIVIQINDTNYLLHKLQFPLLPKCGLLQRLCSDSGDSDIVTIELHDLPGGEDAFELCAKFCYGIMINVSAHNFVALFCAAKFLRMTESVEKGNLVLKLEAFFMSCILEGWKDSIITLQNTSKLPEWSETYGITRKCIDSIVEKILTPPAKVAWSYTYTRPGYSKKHHHSVPKDWWTEDISDLDIDLFRCLITAIRSTYMLSPQLIGEALHVYASRWLPDTTKNRPPESSVSQTEELMEKNRRVLETIVSMIPGDRGSVSVGFMLRLLSIANYLGASPMAKAELIRRSSLQFEEATVNDLLFPLPSTSGRHSYDIDLVVSVLESLVVLWRRISPTASENSQFLVSIRKVGKLIDSYLLVVAKDVNMPVSKIVSLAEALPDIARLDHDDLYKAINSYLKEHPDLSKADKKRLCRILDCQKLSPEVRAHAVKNERLPLRTVVQVLFFEQEKGSKETGNRLLPPPELIRNHTPTIGDDQGKLKLGLDEKSSRGESTRRTITPAGNSEKDQNKMKRSDGKLPLELEKKLIIAEIEETESEKGKEIRGEGMSRSKLDPKKIITKGSRSDNSRDKGRDR
ncbi:BTB/POZ domain-containing protein At5g47800 isoform X1 [Quercus lobata]|uniref:BTB/POZ domain-containing protein At5g47800 isoform X1 n=1 Tax=Quercus lobata TaxID=97700 RepID=UPI001243EC64|nr:BTB/POZ domain-containing protein At5g47800 isoform X1 [Quercus lobata]XP_030972885.1 BTB/POZ domain-containing protein At5g47800 isoform X1 [Quercus lobata]XP_030972886.1 BTB/POZ domain-containing protein At5g47800 isoform X1 [Quercus lobata]XP_030972887.1 BTB/POZ domain-containing protein At5g47800 isoform X1 [Quercus lobata]XP_030972888.1 BTB/POZ domain-containing protein At5g47800 isoform X1 [Quercus lobata]XP_030972889.1 BTB/POZ domain-containing protein At5g47800 isoform X1 [Quercus l